MGGRTLKSIAEDWGMTEANAAKELMPGGASYFQMLAWTDNAITPVRSGRFLSRTRLT